MIKTVLTLIILSFIFFFGYQRATSRSIDAATYAAQVGDEAISRKKLESIYQNTVTRFRDTLKGEVPENMEALLRKNVLDQMIARELLVLYARDLGVSVSDAEVASSIRSNKNLFPDGTLDIKAYERDFLPRYRQQNGEDFEENVQRDLLVEKTQMLAATLFGPWQEELNQSLGEIRKTAKKEEDKPTTESLSSFDLLDSWVNGFRNKVQVEVFER